MTSEDKRDPSLSQAKIARSRRASVFGPSFLPTFACCSSVSQHLLSNPNILFSCKVTHGAVVTFWPAFSTTFGWPRGITSRDRPCVFEYYSRLCCALSPPALSSPFFGSGALSQGPNFSGGGPCEKRCRFVPREASRGVLASPINRNKRKKKGAKPRLPLFTCTQRGDRGDRKRGRAGGRATMRFCTTCVGNEAEKRGAEHQGSWFRSE